MSISHLAVVHPQAQIGSGVIIDAFATVDSDVVIGKDSWIASHAHVVSGSRIGQSCKIYQGAVIGSNPQDLKYQGEKTSVVLGDFVTVREYCTINRGTIASGVTSIGNHSLVMAYTHIAHDCKINDHTILANNVNLAGHVEIGEYAIVGGMTAVQQFLSVGKHSFIGGGTLIRKDVPPYVKAAREPLSFMGVNRIGLERRDFPTSDIVLLQEIYRVLFVKFSNLKIALEYLEDNFDNHNPYYIEIVKFINESRNGIIRGLRQKKI